MTPRAYLLHGDARALPLRTQSVQCVVTSPPYWGLRDYGIGGQLGLESTPDAYVAAMVTVFREVRRVLCDDGTVWINLGDTYAGNRSYQVPDNKHRDVGNARPMTVSRRRDNAVSPCSDLRVEGYKAKDLIGIPWRVAFALQADGWVLRQELIWSKPNPMPESVEDRCTKAHEQVFMFAKARWSGPVSERFVDISDADARWLALFLDAEGNIVIKRARSAKSGRLWYGAQIVFAGSFRPLLQAAQDLIGKGTIHERPGTNAPMFYLQLVNQDARWLLSRIYPFLIVKQRQARVAIHVQQMLSRRGRKRPGGYRSDEHSAALETAWLAVKSLNHFGAPDISWVPEPTRGRWATCERYYYDADAIREAHKPESLARYEYGLNVSAPADGFVNAGAANPRAIGHCERMGDNINLLGRNRRSVWTINTAPYPDAHFATFPPKLIEPCILAGTRPGDLVLDPFVGSGTTCAVALKLGRSAIGVDLNPAYLALASRRIRVTPGLPLEVA